MRFDLHLDIPDVLHGELLACAAESRCSPAQFAAEAVECVLAERRLPRQTSVLSPRMTVAAHGPDYSVRGDYARNT